MSFLSSGILIGSREYRHRSTTTSSLLLNVNVFVQPEGELTEECGWLQGERVIVPLTMGSHHVVALNLRCDSELFHIVLFVLGQTKKFSNYSNEMRNEWINVPTWSAQLQIAPMCRAPGSCWWARAQLGSLFHSMRAHREESPASPAGTCPATVIRFTDFFSSELLLVLLVCAFQLKLPPLQGGGVAKRVFLVPDTRWFSRFIRNDPSTYHRCCIRPRHCGQDVDALRSDHSLQTRSRVLAANLNEYGSQGLSICSFSPIIDFKEHVSKFFSIFQWLQ